MESPRTVGFISDTHGTVVERALRVFAGVDLIVHAGDIGAEGVLEELALIAPVRAVLGNCDAAVYGRDVSSTARFECFGVSFSVVHRPEDLTAPWADVNVFGHTHVPSIVLTADGWSVNPGSPTRPRGPEGPTVALGTIADGRLIAIRRVDLV